MLNFSQNRRVITTVFNNHCRLCPDQKPEKVSMRIDKNPYGWSLDKESQKAKPADEPTESKVCFIR